MYSSKCNKFSWVQLYMYTQTSSKRLWVFKIEGRKMQVSGSVGKIKAGLDMDQITGLDHRLDHRIGS